MVADRLSVVIPTLNAAPTLAAAIGRLPPGCEVIVVDGGSSDGTPAIASTAGARVESAQRGRGTQLAHGAAMATRPWLLFLHADTVLEPGWLGAVSTFVAAPANSERAAVFHLRFDDRGLAPRLVEHWVALRTRALGLPYGDQGLLVARDFYRAMGGHRPLPIMEDVDLVRRIGRRRLDLLRASACTSAARYRRHGYVARGARNLFCLALFFAGVSPARIARLYEGRGR